MPNGFHALLSSNRLSGSPNRITRFSQTRLYNEQAFQSLLFTEPKRSERSGRSFKIVRIYLIDVQGLIVQMNRDVVDTVVKALLRSLRETDYIGWYLEGRIVGGVLTALEHDSAVDVSGRIQQRLMDMLRVELCVEENSLLQIRVCQHHELEGIES